MAKLTEGTRKGQAAAAPEATIPHERAQPEGTSQALARVPGGNAGS